MAQNKNNKEDRDKTPKTILASTVLPWFLVVAFTFATIGTAFGWCVSRGLETTKDNAVDSAISQLPKE